MSTGKMHADEVDTDASLVRRLLAAQFPQWAALPIEPIPSAGIDNAIYRLGDNLAVRLPRIHWAIDQATIERLTDPAQTARDLARFIAALRKIDATDGPIPEPGQRGAPLASRDADTRAAIAASRDILAPNEIDAVTAVWEAALQAPVWGGPPVWIHGDLQAGNLLIHEGRLSAVIDWGARGVGDPACDHQIAWNFFSAESREVFRVTLQDDDASWARGRGWALSVALIALPYYLNICPPIVERSRYTIAEILADHKRGD